MVLGGIITPAANAAVLDGLMRAWRQDHKMFAELKWTKVTDQKFDDYKSFIDLFFDLAKRRKMLFKSIVLDAMRIDYKTYHGGDKEVGFYKFFYQLLLHSFAKHLVPARQRAIVYFDERTTSYSLSDFHAILNNGIKKKYGIKENLIRAVEVAKSHDHDLMQLADILMGAIGFHCNDWHLRPQSRKAKIDLANHIAGLLGLPSLQSPTPRGRDYFEIWRFRLK
jgi:hypothetical protein